MASVSERLRGFLQQRLASMDQIDVVLLLRSDPQRAWTATDVAAALGTAPEPAAMRLFLLASSGLLAFEAAGVPRYRYVTADAETDALIQELAEVCANDRNAIAAIVDVGPRDPLRSFADAFKLKK